MCNESKVPESSGGPHSFEIIGRSGYVVYRPDRPGDSVSVQPGGVIGTKDVAGNFQEVAVLEQGQRVRLID